MSDGWWKRYLQRHPKLSLRSGDATAHVRMDAINQEILKHYFSLLQECIDEQGIKNLLKAVTSLQPLSKEATKEWSTVKLVLFRIENGDSVIMYQGATLTQFNDSMLSRCSDQAKQDLQNLDVTIKQQLAWSNTKLLRSVLAFLDTRCWATPRDVSIEIVDDKSEVRTAIEYIVTVFREPKNGAIIFSLQDEIDEVVDFYRKYLQNQEDYRTVWYRLHTISEARNAKAPSST